MRHLYCCSVSMTCPTHRLLVTGLLLCSSWLLVPRPSAAIRISSSPTHISPRTVNGPFLKCDPEPSDAGCSFSQWTFNGSMIDASLAKYSTGPVGAAYGLQVNDISASDAGVYSCKYTCAGSGETREASYNLIYYHDIVIHTADNIVYHTFLHDNATMHCDTDHETSLQWYFSINNSLITLEGKYTMQGSNLVVRDVTPHEAMGYACRILNPANNPLVIYSSIKVYAPPNITLSGPQSVEEGQSVSIHCSSFGIPKPTLTWIRGNNVIIPGGRVVQTYGEVGYLVSSSLTINQLHQSDAGVYRCSVANTNGTTFSISNITVNIPPQPFIDILPIKITRTNATISLIVGLLNISNNDTDVMVRWRAVGSMMAEGSIVLSAGDNPSFVLHNLTAGTTYIVNATVLLLTDSTVFTTLPDIVVTPVPNHTLYSTSSPTLSTPAVTSTSSTGPIATQTLSEGIMFAIVGGAVLVVLMVMMMVTVLVMVILLRSRRFKNRKIDRFDSSRSDASLMYHKQNSSNSNVSATGTLASNDSFIPRSFTPNSLTPNVVQVVQQPVYMPPHVMYHHGGTTFEMTDNVAFSDQLSPDVRPRFEIGDRAASYSESVSELHDPADELQFEYTDNTNYEGHIPLALRRDPRFEIVSKGRGEVFETVKIKN